MAGPTRSGIRVRSMSSVTPAIDFSTVFSLLSVPCAILDRDLRFVAVNDLYQATLLRRREQLIGLSVLDAFPEVPERQKMIETLFRKALAGEAGSLREIVYRIPGEDGDMEEIWWTVHASPVPGPDGSVDHFALRVEDVTSEVRTRLLKDAISTEMRHRVGNLLALVSTIARRTAMHSTDMSQFIEAFGARIQAMARTQDMLIQGHGATNDFRALVSASLQAYAGHSQHEILIDGPDLNLGVAEAQALSMALHELATNAAKYGALKFPEGRLTISWRKSNETDYSIEWREDGLADIAQPAKEGFGTTILMKILPAQLNGRVTREFTPTSHVYRVDVGD